MTYPPYMCIPENPSYWRVHLEIEEKVKKHLNTKETRVLERYLKVLEPKGFLDKICYYLDGNRGMDYKVTKDILKEREAESVEDKL